MIVLDSIESNKNIPAKDVLDNFPVDAKDVVVIGRTASGELYFASSMGRLPDTLWLLKLAEQQLLEIGIG